MTFGRSIFAFLSCLLPFLLLTPAAAAVPRPEAVQGRLQLPAPPSQPVALQGEWGFAWQEFVDPAWQQLPAGGFARVPASWNELRADGKPPGENGWGSYVLQVDCPRGQALAVEAVPQRTASRLFVNGEAVAAHGEPGPSAEAGTGAVYTRVPISREFACPLRLTLHVSNFEHRAGGFVRPLLAAPADVLAREREARIIYAGALLTIYLLTGAVALIFFAVRRREGTPLLYGLFCLAMAAYTDMIGERLLLRPWSGALGGTLDWVAYMRVEYLAWIASMGLFMLTLRGLFPAEIHRRVVQVVSAALALAAASVFIWPPGVYSHVALPGQAIAVVVALYVAVAMVRARRRSPVDGGVLLAGMVAVLVALAIDLILIDSPGPDRKFAPVGFALFLLSPAIVIARRLSHALNAEERSRTLEENARLREDVERISRHDLKTPLNSILGVARLLGDDARLDGDQRELVGVLQRSGLRMLEMVNLSLGLFRMETGSYDFRPQAVDLRDVVSRVLVDLHSYAEANAVTLHLEGSDRSAVYVRAEDLLCYSIVANLVKNAIEAAGPGRQVTLGLQRGDPATLTVRNPGTVPAEVAARFFEKYLTRGKSGGTGLGTYSARLMARAQQGELRMRTGDPEGTTLTLTLPRLHDEAVVPVPAVPQQRPADDWLQAVPTRQVLLVDDDEYLRLVMRRFLPSPPFQVETAANGQAATEAMLRRWPDYLLLDMEMPLKNGLETAGWVRALEATQGRPRCRMLMLSGNDDPAAASRALAAGVDRFLVKPVSRETLLAALRELEEGAQAAVTLAQRALHDRASTPEDEVVVVDPDWVDVFPGFVHAQRETVESMARALAAGSRDQLQFLAHRAFGGLASMGLKWAAGKCRVLETDAQEAPLHELQQRIAALSEHLGRVRVEPAG
jgi:signal transduction histidine kinase/DNA-binding response OmpR family regulator